MEEVQYFTQPQTNEEQKHKWKQWQLNNIAEEISGSACVVYSNDRATQSGVGKLCTIVYKEIFQHLEISEK